MSRKKSAKKMEKEGRFPNTYPFHMAYFLWRNTNITHSYDCVIKSRHRHPTLVEVDVSSSRSESDDYEREPLRCVKEPYDPNHKMVFCHVVVSKGVSYGMSLQGSVAVLEWKDKGYEILRIGRNRGVPSKVCRQFREYVVESELGNQIYLVFLVSRKSLNVVDDVEVFRLDTERLLWMEEGNIGGNAFFLEEGGGVRFEMSETGFKKNCIYFKHRRIDGWLVFDMETRIILPFLEVKIQTLIELNSS